MLYTQFINTCTGFLGIDEKNGVIFLCHLNTPRSACSLPELVAAIRALGSDLKDFKLYTIGGIHPAMRWGIVLFLAALMWYLFGWGGAVVAMGCSFLFDCARLNLKFQLFRLKAFANGPKSLGYSTACYGLGKTRILVKFGLQGEDPKKESYMKDANDHHFEATSILWKRMTKADGSA